MVGLFNSDSDSGWSCEDAVRVGGITQIQVTVPRGAKWQLIPEKCHGKEAARAATGIGRSKAGERTIRGKEIYL